MHAEPQAQHRWLQKWVGNWVSEVECQAGPDRASEKFHGRETVRSLGELWIICEGEAEMPGGGKSQSIITLGFDPAQDRFVGTFVASVMTHLWPYRGTLDAAQRVLTLDSEGPSFTGTGLAKYQDIFELVSDNERTIASRVLGEDGTWTHFMSGRYRRQ